MGAQREKLNTLEALKGKLKNNEQTSLLSLKHWFQQHFLLGLQIFSSPLQFFVL